MREFNITLTEKEIEILQTCLCETAFTSRSTAEHLEKHNQSGANTKAITAKKDHAKRCDEIWAKLYEIQQKN